MIDPKEDKIVESELLDEIDAEEYKNAKEEKKALDFLIKQIDNS